ncbi:retinol dehydrogenase 13 isoform X3 [Tachyglossus aculeatus]|uniref:retinol dehydrogenase 13 isoform X3 n=1 Tax=Tachyglossus aculeatus TaxID=9261 RepID=UPI0018F3090E|nr:retinol dehydrogenase 13 isoform X3 [Tachyglossus aculeatus]
MKAYLVPLSVLGTFVGGAVLLKDNVTGGTCPSKATIKGKTVVVTGANTGIGKETALELAKRGGRIIMACRDMGKCEAAAKEIRGETLSHSVYARYLDLASLKSVREFAERINQGHFLLTNLLLEKMKASESARIINVSSLAHVAGTVDFDDLNWEKKKFNTKAAYCQSKLANVLFSRELARRLEGTGVTANSLHPGVANTDLGRHTGMHNSMFSSAVLGPLFWLLVKSPRLAAQPSVYLAVAEELEGVSGKYFDSMREKEPAPQAQDEEVAKRLWVTSAQLVGLEETPSRSRGGKTASAKQK